MAYNDIFGKEVDKYWKYEGNNKRMQNYHKIGKVLEKVNFILKWIAFFYFLGLATFMLMNLIRGISLPRYVNLSNYELIMDIIESYLVCLIGGQWLHLVDKLLKIESHSYEESSKRAMIAMPLAFLIHLYCNYCPTGAVIMLIFIAVYILVSYTNSILVRKIKYLYGVATGQEELRNEVEESEEEQLEETIFDNEPNDSADVEVKVVKINKTKRKSKKERKRK